MKAKYVSRLNGIRERFSILELVTPFNPVVMLRDEINNKLLDLLPFDPTDDQEHAIGHISAFEASTKNNPLYILKGYAGTGKTTLIGTYVRFLISTGKLITTRAGGKHRREL